MLTYLYTKLQTIIKIIQVNIIKFIYIFNNFVIVKSKDMYIIFRFLDIKNSDIVLTILTM